MLRDYLWNKVEYWAIMHEFGHGLNYWHDEGNNMTYPMNSADFSVHSERMANEFIKASCMPTNTQKLLR